MNGYLDQNSIDFMIPANFKQNLGLKMFARMTNCNY